MSDRRVGITGLGVVAPGALGAEALWQRLADGGSSIAPISMFDPAGFESRIGGQIEDFSARKFVPKTYRKAVKVMARDIQIAVAAADLACRDAGIITKGIDCDNVNVTPSRFACNIGAGLICTDLDELGLAVSKAVSDGKFDLKKWGCEGIENLTPLWLLKYLPNMLSCHVTIIHNCQGPSNCITCGDASGHMAIGEAGRYIMRGSADIAIAGGAESKLNPIGLMRQQLLNRACVNGNDNPAIACKPFNTNAAGTVVSEGGALVILEDLDRAAARGATIYAELVGFGGACDYLGTDVTRANAGGLDLAVKRAMKDAGITPDDIGFILAHGTAVPNEDIAEVKAWNQSLGQAAKTIPTSVITGSIGSLFAGAGAVELAMAAMSLHKSTAPASMGTMPESGCCEMNISATNRPIEADYAVTGSFSVGGQSGACVLRRYQP